MSGQTPTICAVSTPVGEGGIGIIRISGADAVSIASTVIRLPHGRQLGSVPSHTILYGHVIDPTCAEPIDEALVSVMRAPATYTREDIVEINCHGGVVPLRRTLQLLISAGARQAEPGEFTRRAFLNGRIDLAQAEAVMDIIHARTESSHQAACQQLLGGLSREVAALRDSVVGILAGVEAGIDFPEEDIETPSGLPLEADISAIIGRLDALLASAFRGRVLREGFATAIVGRPNVGKSSLMNALLKQDRAIVTDIPGTTRDVIEEFVNIEGVPVRIIDTAGIRASHDLVEQEGVKRSLAALANADIVLVVLSGAEQLHESDRTVLRSIGSRPAIIVVNKSDLPSLLEPVDGVWEQVPISCRTGYGLEQLRAAIARQVTAVTVAPREHAWAVNQRQTTALEEARSCLEKARDSVRRAQSPEFVALDIRDALDHLGMITGATYTEDILERIFSDFCIGK